jgi:hypothetical protein
MPIPSGIRMGSWKERVVRSGNQSRSVPTFTPRMASKVQVIPTEARLQSRLEEKGNWQVGREEDSTECSRARCAPIEAKWG